MLCNHGLSAVAEQSLPLKGNFVPISSRHVPLPSPAAADSNLLCVAVDFAIWDISYQRDPTVCYN